MNSLHQTCELVGGNDGNILPACAPNDDDLMIVRHAIAYRTEGLSKSGV
jgi:hypothetical protein